MNIPFNQRSNPLFHGEHPFCMAEILSGFSLPLLHFPQREEIPGNLAQSGSEVSSVFFFLLFCHLSHENKGKI